MKYGFNFIKLLYYCDKNRLFFEQFKTHAMNPRDYTDEEINDLKKKLHHAHDKIIKNALEDYEARREFTGKIIMPLLKDVNIDLDNLQLDTNSYTGPSLQAFYSDIVFLTSFIDETTAEKEPAQVALLIEHKSDTPSQLLIRLQIEEYINAIMKRNYVKETDSTIQVIPIIFTQFAKGWAAKSFRSLFPKATHKTNRFIPEFDLLAINLADMPESVMASLNKYGVLKATLLAMKNVRNKEFLKSHFEDIFVFLQEHPDKVDLRKQLVAYIVGHSKFSPEEIQELIKNIFSPVLKQEVMEVEEGFIAIAYKEAKANAEAKAEVALQFQRRLTVMLGWNSGTSLDMITNMASLTQNEVRRLITVFDKVKNYCNTTTDIDRAKLRRLSGLSDEELKMLLELLQKQ